MDEPVWVLDEAVLAIHGRQLAEHGGSVGVRDEGLLASTLARPKQSFAYGGAEATLSRLAAAYAYGIARNHPFVDGNKRPAFVVSLLFLQLNGLTLEASQEEKYEVFMALAAGGLDEPGLSSWIEKRAAPLK